MPQFLVATALTLILPAPAQDPLPFRELAPGVYSIGSSARYGSANLGWVVLGDQVVLIGAPHPDLVVQAVDQAKKTSDKPVRAAVLTQVRRGEIDAIRMLVKRKIAIVASREAVQAIRAGAAGPDAAGDVLAGADVREFADRLELKDGSRRVELTALGHAAGAADTAVFVRDAGVLFTGELCVSGPRAELVGSDTERWIEALERLQELPVRSVVPGFGSVGGPQLLLRQKRYLLELRRQVALPVAMGQSLERIQPQVRIEPEWLVWMPYDNPAPQDIEHVYRELTVPHAPFGRSGAPPTDRAPRALALIGDHVHDPAHIEHGLRLAFKRAGITVQFAFDVRALSAKNLKRVELLVILRDGTVWPEGKEKPYQVWMTPEQERAVVEFVERGGGALLALHNATGIYPEGGPYLKLLGGTYNGHGPLERFRVHVTDAKHPITRGVSEYEIADEQHTPVPDRSKVHIFLESRSDEGVVAAAGWSYEPGRGRVCYLANGHTRESMVHPTYQVLLQNAIRWCLREEARE